MENKHKPKKKNKGDNQPEDEHMPLLSEPAASYGNVPYDSASRTIDIMGMEGKRAFIGIKNDNDLIKIIREGIPKQAMTHLMDIADLTLTEMAAIIHTSDRTLRRYGPAQKLSQEQSERMIEMAKLYSRGEEVFGNLEKFKQWMDTQLIPFGNKKPKEYLDTSLGIGMIMTELGRIEHGIFA